MAQTKRRKAARGITPTHTSHRDHEATADAIDKSVMTSAEGRKREGTSGGERLEGGKQSECSE